MESLGGEINVDRDIGCVSARFIVQKMKDNQPEREISSFWAYLLGISRAHVSVSAN